MHSLSELQPSKVYLCFLEKDGESRYNCNVINYFPKEKYNIEIEDSTTAIPYAFTKSVLFFILATLLIGTAYICCLLGQCSKHRKLFTLVSGLIFVISGLIMLLGLIIYISAFKAELSGKLRPKSQLDHPNFTYRYGFSLFLFLGGIVTSELAGLSSIFLFIHRMQHDFRIKELQDMKQAKLGPSSTNYVQVDQSVFYPCRRHPQAYVNSNSSIHIPTNFPSPVHNRRFFFGKGQVQESSSCTFQRERPCGDSIKDALSVNYLDFPPPPTISYQFEEMKTFTRDSARKFPRDITANTVSTTADISEDEVFSQQYEQYSPCSAKNSNSVQFGSKEVLPLRTQSISSVCSKIEDNFFSDGFNRTTPF